LELPTICEDYLSAPDPVGFELGDEPLTRVLQDFCTGESAPLKRPRLTFEFSVAGWLPETNTL